MLSIADTGCGMPPEVQQHIFEPFYTTKGVGQGTGLGLAMVYGVVQQHEGTISVSSQPGAGTCFQICLPAVPGLAVAYPEPSPSESPGGTETILVAEDEALVRTLMARALQEAGYRVLTAADGTQALDIFFAQSREIGMGAAGRRHARPERALRSIVASRPSIPTCGSYFARATTR